MDALTYLFSLASRNAIAVAASTSSTSSSAAGAGWGILRSAGASAGKSVMTSDSGSAWVWGMAKQGLALGMLMMLSIWEWVVILGGWMTPPQDSAMGLIPFIFRIAAFCIAMPFAVCIALDLIAYGIARTLHLSISARRVPRSPISSPKQATGLSDTDT